MRVTYLFCWHSPVVIGIAVTCVAIYLEYVSTHMRFFCELKMFRGGHHDLEMSKYTIIANCKQALRAGKSVLKL